MAELTGATRGAPVDPAAEHESAAHSGPNGQHHQIVCEQGQRLVVSLSQRRDGRVVVDKHRDPEPLAEHLSQRNVLQRDVDRRDHPAGVELDDRRDADADGAQI